ncbi:dihydrofolate reductase [Clostridium sp. CAG:1000]|jgi:dihydrofolate reductase|nr:dihydrofolate reductase [Clostridium sp. CAG:1000]
MYTIIAAIGKNRELGRDNKLLWSLKGDLKFFKEKTTNHTIIMGRKTFESLGRLLPNRKHVVISSSNNFPKEVDVYNNIESLLSHYKDTSEELFIIGGAKIYSEFIDYATKMYLTLVDGEFDADVYFPMFDESVWTKTVLSENEENGLKYKHVLYEKKTL